MKINWLEVLEPYFSKKVFFDETPVLNEAKVVVGWHSYVFGGDAVSFAGGTHRNREVARRIALAEALERISLRPLIADKVNQYGFDLYPSSSGCAGGFSREKTKFRATCEGLERWAWSQWIDKGYRIEPTVVRPPEQFGPLALHLAESFDEVFLFSKKFAAVELDGEALDLEFKAVLGVKGQGIFPGSRVTSHDDDGWTHGLIEAHRHLDLFNRLKDTKMPDSDWYINRVRYFGNNAEGALRTVAGANNLDWPVPGKIIDLELPTVVPKKFYLHRCLFGDFKAWNRGDNTRFVY